ncbi:GDP-L-fucose synthase [Pelagicoccus sp. SDUM812003]|uniref:GDP-L-fucose synthase family protein n=1 Tax=Pelagicoccus sp. SDUM812003 TaxID=3041267 RepID=UPI00280FD40D|nr:GDP-L-fucose synthase [Pelagicoccus sp. SDUM812003]MDQ8205608.1 GDP-L-fucose synthase [Pelagicoccus sp. SDUM812003]
MTPASKIYVAGASGMVGSAVLRRLHALGFTNTITRSSNELDLTRQQDVEDFFATEKPDVVVMAAAKVGGIHANNTYPADFGYINLVLASNTIHAAYQNGVSRFLFLGSSCIYPKLAPQPLREDCLLTSELEPTNEAYAIAKIAGLKLCEYYRKQHGVTYHSLMPTNLYGPGDNYHPENSHLLPALIRRFHEAKEAGAEEVTMWGTGKPLREMMHADDLADAVVFALQLPDPPSILNAGTGVEHSIRQIAELVAETVGFEGKIVNDLSKPDGTPRKLMDVSRLRELGWTAQIPLEEGIRKTYPLFLAELEKGSLRAK